MKWTFVPTVIANDVRHDSSLPTTAACGAVRIVTPSAGQHAIPERPERDPAASVQRLTESSSWAAPWDPGVAAVAVIAEFEGLSRPACLDEITGPGMSPAGPRDYPCVRLRLVAIGHLAQR